MKLFWRLLLWFLAANGVTAAVALLLGTWIAGFAYSEADALRDGEAAAAIYEHEGSEALGLWLREQWRQAGIMGMLHDAQGMPLGRPRMPIETVTLNSGRVLRGYRTGPGPAPAGAGAGASQAAPQVPGDEVFPGEPGPRLTMRGSAFSGAAAFENGPLPPPGVFGTEPAPELTIGGQVFADGGVFERVLEPPTEEGFRAGPLPGFSLRSEVSTAGPQLRRVSVTTESGKNYRWVGSKPAPRGNAAFWRDALLRVMVSLLVIGAAAWLAARRIVRPVADLERASLALAGGDLTTRVQRSVVGRDDELGSLGSAFNDMAERISKLVDSHRRLLRDVSHELRTPLARLRIAAELAREKGEARHFDRIEAEAEQLTALIQQVLLLARLDDPQTAAQDTGTFSLTELLIDLCARARLEAAQHKVEVVSQIVASGAVRGREATLRSALENILRNALRFAPEGSSVLVGLSRQEQTFHIEICDHGPGVPADALAAIFQPFVRVSSARERDSGGVGLGLTIADAAVRAHGGTISARNRSDGGLCVDVKLPVASP
ncbi:MAG TPA: ATP-binding protein [Solimonas sp.]|nr:ATP-binding protein [Solimonas sp.]